MKKPQKPPPLEPQFIKDGNPVGAGLILIVIALIILFLLVGCGSQPVERHTRDLFHRGELVKIKLDGSTGMVIDKREVWDFNKNIYRWSYETRVKNNLGSYDEKWFQEFELEPPKAEKENGK